MRFKLCMGMVIALKSKKGVGASNRRCTTLFIVLAYKESVTERVLAIDE